MVLVLYLHFYNNYYCNRMHTDISINWGTSFIKDE